MGNSLCMEHVKILFSGEVPYYGKIVSENRLLVMRLNWVGNPIYPLGSTCHSRN